MKGCITSEYNQMSRLIPPTNLPLEEKEYKNYNLIPFKSDHVQPAQDEPDSQPWVGTRGTFPHSIIFSNFSTIFPHFRPQYGPPGGRQPTWKGSGYTTAPAERGRAKCENLNPMRRSHSQFLRIMHPIKTQPGSDEFIAFY